MKVQFKTWQLQQFYELEVVRGKQKFPLEVVKQYKRKVDILIDIENVTKLRQHKSLNFKMLKGDRKGEYSIRLNDQYRLIFEEIKTKEDKVVINILIINEISKHYE